MMKIDVKINSSELAGILRSGAYDLPEGATVGALMEMAQCEADYAISQELAANLVFLYNNRHAVLDTVMSESGKLRVLHKVLGG